MMHLSVPSSTKIEQFLLSQRDQEFSYPLVGGTQTGQVPTGFDVHKQRVLLGSGEAVFDAACEALASWKMFPEEWTKVYSSQSNIQCGAEVAVLAHAYRLWWLNACRIVYTIDEHQPLRRYGFAYGTLPSHVESGEERFLIEWDQEVDQVWYEISSFSLPRHLLVRAAYPLARRMQARFIRDSLAQMKRLIASASIRPSAAQVEPQPVV